MNRSRLVLTLLAICTLLANPSWGQSALLRGLVTDVDSNPLSGVTITVTSEQLGSYRKTLTSDEDGAFSIRFQSTQLQYQFDFLFEKPGFQSFSQPISPSATRRQREIFVMERGKSQVVESHGDLAAVVTGSTNEAVTAFNEGLTAQRAGEFEVARGKFEQALAADETLAPAHLALAQVLLDQKSFEAAAARADSALALPGDRAGALRVKYAALRALGREKEAEAVAVELEQAEDAAATAVRLYNEGGEAFQSGDRDTALERFRRAAELDPTLFDAHHAVATLELARGDYEASAEAAKTALALGTEDVRTLRVLYDAYDALGRIEELTEIAPRLAAVDPDFGGAKLIEQSADLWNAGQSERAVTLARLALAIDPGLAKAHYFLGLDHLSKGKNAEARAALEKFIELAPDDPEAATAQEMLSYIGQ